MAKSVKSLTGAEKDAYLARVAAGDGKAAGDVLAQRLASEVTRVWVKVEALAEDAPTEDTAAVAEVGSTEDDFDPFQPNVVVVLRRGGRDKALSELAAITAADRLKRLAREQQLTIPAELVDVQDIRVAIVAAAERRVANRRAAAT